MIDLSWLWLWFVSGSAWRSSLHCWVTPRLWLTVSRLPMTSQPGNGSTFAILRQGTSEQTLACCYMVCNYYLPSYAPASSQTWDLIFILSSNMFYAALAYTPGNLNHVLCSLGTWYTRLRWNVLPPQMYLVVTFIFWKISQSNLIESRPFW